MKDGAIVFSTALDNREMEKQLNSLTKKIQTQTDKLNQKQLEQTPLAEQSKQLATDLDAAKARLEYMKSGQEFFTANSVTQQAATVKTVQKEWDVTQNKVERYDSAIVKANAELERNKVKAGAIAKELNTLSYKSMPAFSEAVKKSQKRLATFKRMFDRTVIRATSLVFVYKAIQGIFEYFSAGLKTSQQYVKAVGQLKAALLTLAQPLVNVVIPAVTKLTQVLATLLTYMAKFVSMISGKSMQASKNSAESLYNQKKAINGVGSAAKKASKQLATFDEINQIGGDSSTSSGSGASVDEIAPDFSGLGEFDTIEYKEKIDELTAYISGALLALGTILTFSGANIPLGLGLMAVGAIGLAAEANENWNTTNNKVKNAVNQVLITLGGAQLAIGAILTFSGNFATGIPLLALGAAALITVATLNWTSIKQALQGRIGAVTAIVSSALLAIGAILAFSGVKTPLGISLMAAGALGLIAVTHLNWETITTALQGPIGKITALVGGALLVLGAVLLFSGANVPLGIGMLIAGGAALATTAAINWDTILDCLKGAWSSIKTWWRTNVSPKLTLSFWHAKFDTIRSALVKKIKDAVNGGITLFNKFIGWINEKMNISWPALKIAGKTIIPAGSFQLIELPEIPMLAQGAVIPPNREFMAVLGDQKSGNNIEAPEGLIRRIVKEESGGGNRPITVIFELDKREFGRIVYQANNEETQRVGVRFAT